MKKYQLGLYEKAVPASLTWEERFAAAKAAGFDFLELSIDETDERLSRLDWSAGQRHDLAEISRASGVPIRSICLSGHRKYPLGSQDPVTRARALEIAFKAIDLAGDLGIRLIQLAGYDVYYEEGDSETEAYFAANLARVTAYAASREVALGFETMETSFMDTVAKAMRYVKLVQSPWLGVYPDIGNLSNAALLYGHEVAEDLKSGAGHIFAAHLKETIPGHYREVPFGTGHTKFIGDIELLRELGVYSYVGEFWYTGGLLWREDLANAGKFLRDKLDQVFTEEE